MANTPTLPNSPMPGLNTFPPEIRLMIWQWVLEQPRLHRVRIDFNNNKFYPTSTLRRSMANARAVLETCSESRSIAQEILPNEISLVGGGVLRYNAQKDVICIVDFDIFDTFDPRKWYWFRADHRAPEAQWMHDIQNVGIEVPKWDERNTGYWLEYMNHATGMIRIYMAQFEALLNLYLVSQAPGVKERKVWHGRIDWNELHGTRDDGSYWDMLSTIFDMMMKVQSDRGGFLNAEVLDRMNESRTLVNCATEESEEILPGEGACFAGTDDDRDRYLWGYQAFELFQGVDDEFKFARLGNHLLDVLGWKHWTTAQNRGLGTRLTEICEEEGIPSETIRVMWLLHDRGYLSTGRGGSQG